MKIKLAIISLAIGLFSLSAMAFELKVEEIAQCGELTLVQVKDDTAEKIPAYEVRIKGNILDAERIAYNDSEVFEFFVDGSKSEIIATYVLTGPLFSGVIVYHYNSKKCLSKPAL